MSAKMKRAHNAVAAFACKLGRVAIRREGLHEFFPVDAKLYRAILDTRQSDLVDAACLLIRGDYKLAVLHGSEATNG